MLSFIWNQCSRLRNITMVTLRNRQLWLLLAVHSQIIKMSYAVGTCVIFLRWFSAFLMKISNLRLQIKCFILKLNVKFCESVLSPPEDKVFITCSGLLTFSEGRKLIQVKIWKSRNNKLFEDQNIIIHIHTKRVFNFYMKRHTLYCPEINEQTSKDYIICSFKNTIYL